MLFCWTLYCHCCFWSLKSIVLCSFFCRLWLILLMDPLYLQWWRFLFLFLFLKHISCQYHLSGESLRQLHQFSCSRVNLLEFLHPSFQEWSRVFYEEDSPCVYSIDGISAAELGLKKFSRWSEILFFIFYFISSCLIESASNIHMNL